MLKPVSTICLIVGLFMVLPVDLALCESRAVHNTGLGPALIRAARQGHESEVRGLLARGTEVNARDKLRRTALGWAARRRHRQTVKKVLAAGGDIHAKDDGGYTALHWAAGPSPDEKLIAILLAAGADVAAKTIRGDTPLHCAVSNRQGSTIKMLLRAGADVNARNNDGATPLHGAARGDEPTVTSLLLSKGADVNARARFGFTPLIIAASRVRVAICADSSSKIPNRLLENVKLLVAAGADVNARDTKWRQTALGWALKTRKKEIADFLKAHGAKE